MFQIHLINQVLLWEKRLEIEGNGDLIHKDSYGVNGHFGIKMFTRLRKRVADRLVDAGECNQTSLCQRSENLHEHPL